MQANKNYAKGATVVSSIALALILVFGIIGSVGFANLNQKLEGFDVNETAIANAVSAGIVIPEMPEFDVEKLDRVCELTEGCEYWESQNVSVQLNALNVSDAWEDFEEFLIDFSEIDEDYLEYNVTNLKDHQVRAYSDDDEDDENWEVKAFIRVEYIDTDFEDWDDYEIEYFVVTSVLDEGEYDSLTVEEVSRNFEFN